MNKREAREQLMNSDSSSGGGDLPKDSSSSSSGGGGISQNRKRQATLKQQQRQHEKQKPVLETVALDMAHSNGAGDNNSSSNLKKLTGDFEKMTSTPSNESNPSSSCSKTTKCLIIFSMSLTIILTAILIAIFRFDLLGNDDQCLSANSPFQNNLYKLFTTKTAYQTAFDHLGDAIKSNDAPSVFSKQHSLKSINDYLTTAPNSCKVRQLHYYGRHAARYPDAADIKDLNRVISDIQSRIDLSKFLVPTQVSASGKASGHSRESDPAPLVGGNSTGNPDLQHEQVCSNPMTSYKQWRSLMHPDQDNLVTDSGFQETEAIAARLREIFPQMFNASHSDIKIHTTKEIRTAQTAVPFIKKLVNYTFSQDCQSEDSFPSHNLSSKVMVSKIRTNKCLNDLNTKSFSENLQFHKKCDSMAKKNTTVGPKLNLDHLRSIARSISKNLKLASAAHLSPGEVEKLYSICKYETALTGSSIWCNLFGENDLKFLEYVDDLEDFYKDAYGDNDQARVACPVAVDIMDAFEDAESKKTLKPQTHLHFTHSQVIRKMLAASFDLQSDQAYTDTAVERHLKEGSVPGHRDWRTSLFTPFSANLLFTLYECNSKFSNGYMDMQVNSHPYQVVVSLNEQPVLMHNCPGLVCGFDKFKNSKFGRIGFKPECDLKYFCGKKYKMINDEQP